MTKLMHYILLGLFICLSVSLSAQMEVETKSYPLYKKVNERATSIEFARYLGNGETISMWNTIFAGSIGSSKFVKSSGDNPIVLERKIESSSPFSGSEILLTEIIGDDLIIAYEHENKQEDVTELRIAKMNTQTLEFDTDEVFMTVKRFGPNGAEKGYITVGLTADKSHFAALGVDGSRKGEGSAAKVKTLNLETEEIMETPLSFDTSFSVSLNRSKIVPLSDNGAALTFRIIYPINERRVFKQASLAAPHEYLLIVLDGSGKGVFSQTIEVEERVITDVNIGETGQGTLTIAGWLADEKLEDVNELYSSTGAFSTSLSLSDYTLKTPTVFDFGKDLLGMTRNSPIGRLNSLMGYVNLTTLETFVGSDGAFWMVAEEQIGWTTEYTTARLGIDVLVARVSSSGEIEWVDKLAARSNSQGSKFSWLSNDDLYVVYRDSQKNEGIIGGGFSHENVGETAMALGYFSKTGEVKKKHFNHKDILFSGGFAGPIEGGIASFAWAKRLNYVVEIKLK